MMQWRGRLPMPPPSPRSRYSLRCYHVRMRVTVWCFYGEDTIYSVRTLA
jgi:hypothetical protein